jgi:oligopeptide/dipeptide ABC transporter ATP-binding protein
MGETVLEVSHLRVAFRLGDGRESVPVRDVSFRVPRGGRVALVGESGCGKSLTALALGGLVDRAELGGTVSGGARLAYVFQNPAHALNPVVRVGAQTAEAVRGLSRRARAGRVRDLFVSVGLPAESVWAYPCELSGGQQQRVMIAMALAAEPDVLVADEPTTALDVTTQKEVLDLIDRVADARAMAVLLITHNLGLVAEHAREMSVMYAGQIVEAGPVDEILRRPRHPYTRGLIGAVPRLDAPKDAPLADIPGTVPAPDAWPVGCAFHPRCPSARETCASPFFTACPEM